MSQADVDAEVQRTENAFRTTRGRLLTPADGWQNQASCRSSDPTLWFGHTPDEQAAAVAICNACPVRSDCLDYALTNRIDHGIWGGATEADRLKVVRKKHIDIPPLTELHGTTTAYVNGCRCRSCKHAMAMVKEFGPRYGE